MRGNSHRQLFEVAQRHELDIHPNALHLITRSLSRITKDVQNDPKANALFVHMMTSLKDPETTLRRLNEAGVFGKFINDFGRVVAQMQYDMYHVYTTDEHTIRAIGILSRIERVLLKDDHPLASEAQDKPQCMASPSNVSSARGACFSLSPVIIAAIATCAFATPLIQ